MQVQLDLPDPLARVMAALARADGVSLDEFAVRVLTHGIADRPGAIAKRDLSFMGRMSDDDARAIEDAHDLMDRAGMPADL